MNEVCGKKDLMMIPHKSKAVKFEGKKMLRNELVVMNGESLEQMDEFE